MHPAVQLVGGKLRLDVLDDTRHGIERAFELTVGEELAGLEGIIVSYDDVEAFAGDEPKVVEGERALLRRKSPGANKRAGLGIVPDEPH
jgi:hypothetical protein